MANPEHLEILEQGVEAWNKWRVEHPEIEPDLISDSLYGMDLSGINLANAHLRDVNLANAHLRDANLKGADLDNVSLCVTELTGANLRGANLSRADLSGADLDDADLSYADLGDATLINAQLENTDLSGARLSGTNFHLAHTVNTFFVGVDLREVKGLETVRHWGPSEISISTIYRSQGEISEVFLRGCGVPEEFITYNKALVGSKQAIQFYSCFISYSSKDKEFAERLHSDLQAKRVRVWFAPHDMKIGARIRPTIDESIRVYDKLLLVLSEASVGSQWVEQEVETALAREREPAGKTVLFPVRIDDSIMQINTGWPAYLKNTRNVGDFTDWKDHDSYREAFDRLLRDLRAEA